MSAMPDSAAASPQQIPKFIQSQLENPPIRPSESASEFRSLFSDLCKAAPGIQRTATEYAMLLQATLLTFRAIGLERIRNDILRHNRPKALVNLLRRTHRHAEHTPIAGYDANAQRIEYFASKEARKQIEAQFVSAGYAADAVDIEAFELALRSLAAVERQIAAAQKQLMAFLKEIERRDGERAQALRKAALDAVSREQQHSEKRKGP